MSIKQAIEALEELIEYAETAGFDWSLDNARAALAALRSMPTTLGKGINRDDTVHGEEYFTRAEVESVLRSMPAEPNKGALIGEFTFDIEQTCSACDFHGAQEDCEVCQGEVTYNQPVTVPWTTIKEIHKAIFATPHTEAVRMSDQEIDAITDQQWRDKSDTPIYAAHRAYARAVEQATAARLGVKMGDV